MRKWFVSIVVALLSAASLAPSAFAATPAAPTTGGQGLEISPPVVELIASPGQILTTNIKVRNITTGSLFVRGQVNDFGAGTKEDGSPQILVNETGATRYSLQYWVQNVPDLNLAPQELKSVPITINVPKDAEPGGHYGVVRFTGVPPSLQGTGVSLAASVGTLILLKVAGQITDNLSVSSLNSGNLLKNGDFTNKGFFEYGPIDFNIRLKNDGSVHEKAVGRLVVKNMFGHTVAAIAVNDKGGNVLPNSIRRFGVQLSNKSLFGYYSATLNLTYLNGTKTLTASTHFIVIPWKMILLIIILLIALFFVLRIAMRRYNERIIAQARRR